MQVDRGRAFRATLLGSALSFSSPCKRNRPTETTQRLQCSSFLVMAYFWLMDYDILPKKELHSSLWVPYDESSFTGDLNRYVYSSLRSSLKHNCGPLRLLLMETCSMSLLS